MQHRGDTRLTDGKSAHVYPHYEQQWIPDTQNSLATTKRSTLSVNNPMINLIYLFCP